MSTPLTLTVVVLLLGLAAAFGASQSQISRLRDDVAELAARQNRVDPELASMSATLKKVDANVDELLRQRRPIAS